MAGKVKKEEQKRIRLEKTLIEEHERWQELYKHGGADPHWPDGTNLNLVRNHILWSREKMEEELEPGQFPKCYFWEVPPKVPADYMADADGIRRDARKTLETVTKHPDFAYLEDYQYSHSMTDKRQKKLAPVSYVRWLSNALENDDLVYARRYRDPARLLEQIHASRKELEEMEEKKRVLPMGQLSIFDFM